MIKVAGELLEPAAATAKAGDGGPIATPATPGQAVRTLAEHKRAIRRYAPLALPWPCRARCSRCGDVVEAEFVRSPDGGAVHLRYSCPACGPWSEPQHDTLFTPPPHKLPDHRKGQPATTFSGSPIQPMIDGLPRTVETLCPECSAVILGRYFESGGVVRIEKTCPRHGYFSDRISTDVRLYRKGLWAAFQDERGPAEPRVRDGRRCPSDCGLCNQHTSTAVLGQIDLTNRCNLKCPVCFANANAAGYVSEPDRGQVGKMLDALRQLHPHPATAVQFTGGEPTLHQDFLAILDDARRMGFSHIQIATNGLRLADYDFARRAADAGLHTLYLQFDGVDDSFYRQTRGQALMDRKLACIENCRRTGMKAVLVPTIIKGFNDSQVGPIFRFAIDNIDAVSAISYQPVCFTGRIDRAELEAKRYTLGDLAHDLAAASGADLERDFWPLSVLSPLSRILECIDGKSKIRASCHSDCAFGTYFFVTPDRRAVPIPKLFDIFPLLGDFNELAARIQGRGDGQGIVRSGRLDMARLAWAFVRRYRWKHFFKADIKPWTFIRALQGLTNKQLGRGEGEKKSYKTLMAAGMHFMDRHNYDVARVRRCGILYSTPDGIYPFCTINGGPEYRPLIERLSARTPQERSEESQRNQ